MLWNLSSMIFEVAEIDQKLKTSADLVSELWCAQFLWNLAPEQIEHANYGGIDWNWWPLTQYYKSDKFGPKTEMCSNFHEMWHSGHIWYPNYQYSTLNEWPRPKEKTIGKFCPKLEMCAIFMNFDAQS